MRQKVSFCEIWGKKTHFILKGDLCLCGYGDTPWPCPIKDNCPKKRIILRGRNDYGKINSRTILRS